MDNSSLNKCPKPSGQAFRPPAPFGQCPNRPCNFLSGASLRSLDFAFNGSLDLHRISICLWLWVVQYIVQGPLSFYLSHMLWCTKFTIKKLCSDSLINPLLWIICSLHSSNTRIIWQTVRLHDEMRAKALAKFWQLVGLWNTCLHNVLRKMRSIDFQRCITRWVWDRSGG